MLETKAGRVGFRLSHMTEFSDAWQRAKPIDGWLSHDQAQALYTAAVGKRDGAIVEIGSHHGRSTVILGATGHRVVAIDPFDNARWGGGEDAHSVFQRNVDGLEIELIRKTSSEAADGWDGAIGLLFLDGSHALEQVRRDMDEWQPEIVEGGRIFIHDAFSCIAVTKAILERHLFNRRWRYRGAAGSLVCFERTHASIAESAWDALRLTWRLGWLARNLAIKLAMRRGNTSLPRLLGHRESCFPY